MIDRIMMYTIGTGLLTSAFNVAGLVAGLTMTHNLVYVMLLELKPKREQSPQSQSKPMFTHSHSSSVPQLHAYIVRILRLTCCTYFSSTHRLNARRSLSEIGEEGVQIDLTDIRFPSRVISSSSTGFPVGVYPANFQTRDSSKLRTRLLRVRL